MGVWCCCPIACLNSSSFTHRCFTSEFGTNINALKKANISVLPWNNLHLAFNPWEGLQESQGSGTLNCRSTGPRRRYMRCSSILKQPVWNWPEARFLIADPGLSVGLPLKPAKCKTGSATLGLPLGPRPSARNCLPSSKHTQTKSASLECWGF